MDRRSHILLASLQAGATIRFPHTVLVARRSLRRSRGDSLFRSCSRSRHLLACSLFSLFLALPVRWTLHSHSTSFPLPITSPCNPPSRQYFPLVLYKIAFPFICCSLSIDAFYATSLRLRLRSYHLLFSVFHALRIPCSCQCQVFPRSLSNLLAYFITHPTHYPYLSTLTNFSNSPHQTNPHLLCYTIRHTSQSSIFDFAYFVFLLRLLDEEFSLLTCLLMLFHDVVCLGLKTFSTFLILEKRV